MTSRKERRARQYIREQQGLPKARPWTYAKENRQARMRKLLEGADQRIAEALGIPAELVQKVRMLDTVTRDTVGPVSS